MIRTIYPETPMDRELRLARKAAKDEAYAAANGGEMPVKKGRSVNKGWTAKTLASAKTRVNTTDLSPLINMVKNCKDTHVAFMVLTYPAKRITLRDEVHADIIKFNKEIRKCSDSPYVRSIEFKWNKQAHINYVMALTKAQVKYLQAKWMKIAGWDSKASMGQAANYTLSNDAQEKNIGTRNLFNRVLNYLFMIGQSEKAAIKSHQYRMPAEWMTESGSGAMWSMSSELKQMATEELPITNRMQREAVDRYVKRAFAIQDKMVQWQLADGSLTREFNLAAFGEDRIAGSKHVGRITERMQRNIAKLIAMYA